MLQNLNIIKQSLELNNKKITPSYISNMFTKTKIYADLVFSIEDETDT